MRNAVAVCLVLVAINVLVYGQVRDFAFIAYDDPGHVLDRPELCQGLSPAGMAWVFSTTFVGNYIPITGLTFLADYQLHSLEAGGYHLTSLLFHIANTLLLFAFLARTTRALWPSAFVAALFAVHPMHVESVAWISGRKDVVSTFFGLLTLLAYAGYARRPGRSAYLAVFTLLALGLLAKAMLVTLPFVLLLLDVWPLKRLEPSRLREPATRRALRRLVLEKVPLLIPVLVISALTLIIQERSGAVSSREALPLYDRAANALVAYMTYPLKMFWPSGLIPFYPHPVGGIPAWKAAAAALSLLLITAGVFRAGSKRPYLPVGWLWYLGTLVPVIGLVQVGAQAMADRYTYVPLVGLFIMVAWGVPDLLRGVAYRRAALAGAAAFVLTALAWAGWHQTAHWRDTVSLFTYTVEVDPDNVVGHSLLGKALYDRGDRSEGQMHLERAIELNPAHTPALLNLGIAYVEQGRIDEAIRCYTAILNAHPGHPDALNNLGGAYVRLGKPDRAIEVLEKVIAIEPDHADALTNLGAALLLERRPLEAARMLQRAIELQPGDEVAQLNLAVAYFRLGQHDAALRRAREALRIEPDYAKASAFIEVLEKRNSGK